MAEQSQKALSPHKAFIAQSHDASASAHSRASNAAADRRSTEFIMTAPQILGSTVPWEPVVADPPPYPRPLHGHVMSSLGKPPPPGRFAFSDQNMNPPALGAIFANKHLVEEILRNLDTGSAASLKSTSQTLYGTLHNVDRLRRQRGGLVTFYDPKRCDQTDIVGRRCADAGPPASEWRTCSTLDPPYRTTRRIASARHYAATALKDTFGFGPISNTADTNQLRNKVVRHESLSNYCQQFCDRCGFDLKARFPGGSNQCQCDPTPWLLN